MNQRERDLGNKWAATHAARGHWSLKLHAAGATGLPDWLLAAGKLMLVEAKLSQDAAVAYHPKQLRTGQAWMLEMIGKHAPGHCAVVVLGDEGFVELGWPELSQPLPMAEFKARRERYRDGGR